MATEARINRTDKDDPITETSWPKHKVQSIDCRKRDIIVRIADWTRQSIDTGEPAYDVEVYVHGVYDWNLSKSFTMHSGLTKAQAKQAAVAFAAESLAKLL